MILADTAIWVDHLNRTDAVLEALLDADCVLMHPYVLGEIVMGNLRRRTGTLADLRDLTQAPVAEPEELLAFVERHALFGAGIGYVDAHLLASTLLASEARLWTRDKRLHAAAERLGIAAKPAS